MRYKLMAPGLISRFTMHVPPIGTPIREAVVFRICRRAGYKNHVDERLPDGRCIRSWRAWHRADDRLRWHGGNRPGWSLIALCGSRAAWFDATVNEHVDSGVVVDLPGSDGARVCTRCERVWSKLRDPE